MAPDSPLEADRCDSEHSPDLYQAAVQPLSPGVKADAATTVQCYSSACITEGHDNHGSVLCHAGYNSPDNGPTASQESPSASSKDGAESLTLTTANASCADVGTPAPEPTASSESDYSSSMKDWTDQSLAGDEAACLQISEECTVSRPASFYGHSSHSTSDDDAWDGPAVITDAILDASSDDGAASAGSFGETSASDSVVSSPRKLLVTGGKALNEKAVAPSASALLVLEAARRSALGLPPASARAPAAAEDGCVDAAIAAVVTSSMELAAAGPLGTAADGASVTDGSAEPCLLVSKSEGTTSHPVGHAGTDACAAAMEAPTGADAFSAAAFGSVALAKKSTSGAVDELFVHQEDHAGCTDLLLHNLAADANEDTIRSLLSAFGPLKSIETACGSHYSIVSFATAAAAHRAHKALNGKPPHTFDDGKQVHAPFSVCFLESACPAQTGPNIKAALHVPTQMAACSTTDMSAASGSVERAGCQGLDSAVAPTLGEGPASLGLRGSGLQRLKSGVLGAASSAPCLFSLDQHVSRALGNATTGDLGPSAVTGPSAAKDQTSDFAEHEKQQPLAPLTPPNEEGTVTTGSPATVISALHATTSSSAAAPAAGLDMSAAAIVPTIAATGLDASAVAVVPTIGPELPSIPAQPPGQVDTPTAAQLPTLFMPTHMQIAQMAPQAQMQMLGHMQAQMMAQAQVVAQAHAVLQAQMQGIPLPSFSPPATPSSMPYAGFNPFSGAPAPAYGPAQPPPDLCPPRPFGVPPATSQLPSQGRQAHAQVPPAHSGLPPPTPASPSWQPFMGPQARPGTTPSPAYPPPRSTQPYPPPPPRYNPAGPAPPQPGHPPPPPRNSAPPAAQHQAQHQAQAQAQLQAQRQAELHLRITTQARGMLHARGQLQLHSQSITSLRAQLQALNHAHLLASMPHQHPKDVGSPWQSSRSEQLASQGAALQDAAKQLQLQEHVHLELTAQVEALGAASSQGSLPFQALEQTLAYVHAALPCQASTLIGLQASLLKVAETQARSLGNGYCLA